MNVLNKKFHTPLPCSWIFEKKFEANVEGLSTKTCCISDFSNKLISILEGLSLSIFLSCGHTWTIISVLFQKWIPNDLQSKDFPARASNKALEFL